MGMVVRTNTMAQNAYRQLGVNNTAVGKSLEKLSSGFRINRAADDASGLAISEKMKAQIKGLEQASANSQDGISLIQTAEGATTEIHNMLNRMTELATKSANGTIQDPVDREAIQQEVNDLNKEITRIAQSTNFNGINLLDGNLSADGTTRAVSNTGKLDLTAFGISKGGVAMDFTDTDKNGTLAVDKYTTAALGAGETAAIGDKITVTMQNSKTGETKTIEVSLSKALAAAAAKDVVGGQVAEDLAANSELAKLFTVTADATSGELSFEATGFDQGWSVTSLGSDNQDLDAAISTAGTAVAEKMPEVTLDNNGTFGAGDTLSIGGKKYEIVANADDKATKSGYKAVTAADLAKTLSKDTGLDVTDDGNGLLTFKQKTTAVGEGGLKLQVGDTNAEYNHVTVSVDDLSAAGIGTEGLDVSNQDAAGAAIDTIRSAINQVSTNRANLGSLQNRLEYTINNLDTTAENMTAANSRIRDTDMAKEMMNYTKMNILTQSAQAMLAQANQQPQAILQLLQ